MFKQIASRLGRAVSAGRKAFTMTFARAASYWYLPRTRFDYGDGSQSIDNSIVGACVLWLARNFPEAPFQVLRLRAQKWTQEPLHALALLIERPNMFYSGPLLWMATVIEFALFGNAYWVKIRNGSRAVIQLWWVPNGMIEPKRDEGSTDLITHYEYKPGSTPIRLAVTDVVHFRFGIDPANMMKGLAPLRSLLREIFTDDEASNFTAALLKNLGVPGIVITPDSDDVDLDPEDAEAIREDFATKFTSDGRGSAMVISSKSRVTQVSFSPEQMNLRELRRIPEERVSAVIGVPAVVVGLGAGLDRSTYSNMAEAKENAWEMGIIPMQRLLCSTLDVQLLPDFEAGRNFRTGFDLSQVRALQDDVDKLAARTDVGVKGGYVEVYEARQALGLMVDESMHYYIRSFNTVEVMADEAGANAEEPEEPEELPTGSVETVPPEALENTPKGARLRFVIKGRREREAAINNFAARLTPVLADLGERVAGKVKAVKAPGDDLVTDADVARLVRLLRGGHVEAVSRASVESADAIGVDPFAIDDPVAVRLLNELGEDIVGITEETRRSVAQTVAAGREDGATSAEIAERLRNSHAFSAARAGTIARTELTRAENRTSIATWKDSGFVEQVSILDGDGCGWTDHDDPDLADGSTRTLDDFEEHEMAHPNAVLEGSTFASYGETEELIRAQYSGPAIRLRAGSHEVTIGPNHPMLTPRGFVRARDLKEGDELIYDKRADLSTGVAVKSNLEKVPFIEDAFEALRPVSSYASVPLAADDFHGDAMFCYGEVEVIRPERQLLDVWNIYSVEQERELALAGAYAQTPGEASFGSRDTAAKRVLIASSGVVGGSSDGVVSASHFVSLPIVEVQPVLFEGWAFDATTQYRLYNSDGFVVSNCVRVAAPIVDLGKSARRNGHRELVTA